MEFGISSLWFWDWGLEFGDFCFKILSSVFRVLGFGLLVWSLEFGVLIFWHGIWSLEIGVCNLVVWDIEFVVFGLGF